MGDARAALRWLAARTEVLSQSIHVLGWSNGAATVLQAIKGEKGEIDAAALAFRSAVAMYPSCRDLVGQSYSTTVPLLIQAGGADDWTPARECEQLVGETRGRGGPIEIDVYENAHHAFDMIEGSVRLRPEVRNLSSPSGRGAHVGPDPAAREKARSRVLKFLDTHR